MANIKLKNYQSYAKINLFLHILNKRDDGYHNLQTWFTFLDLKDHISFRFNNSNKIEITSNIQIASKEDNLIYKAVKEFQKVYKIESVGVEIDIIKNIPMGAGLGGGSSNAATTLIALRDYYLPELSNEQMIPLATKLGADVPIFVYGRSAWAEGIGDVLYSKDFEQQYVLLVKPNIHISTKEFFESESLVKTKNMLPRDLSFDTSVMHNYFENVFFAKYPKFKSQLDEIDQDFRMTGTGSCFYLLSKDLNKLQQLARKVDKSLDKWVVKTLNYAY
ncbi:4-(cytidine 5'-diphospho)-2-C-methyl-D-erythritol kinase [Francisella philomiragia]|uniref:4-(cytidine 5'-diphospho)-2-C-methyl-D-erythritol kinase n=1 Tax=Francisella philomiragia TaxID=28110 RepID=UPI001904AE61|nr:4-(cytidine 5'-diphospho)-2-C-methyl-D-erythritol kinase [Francisella philomiragia]MBK2278422.1 4-(cytidine 5'-diphospho)-2-C-methyl-D-erythritol kinase [Francisella philomiragia]MBK2286388.1 4-(cytidine 5'-diphospho)-2-C-methyl-D-erythritol kinase [Francisella philomiragia]MBK2288253.1 4-(cytidine 5'-diphospho)-2-C-methyl-D-erythritol kinase [Francisella philomiragia]MBK2291201.1 4-(cytidine 5'-diphospho)-2-C-methyl-D-erythritol kinase [Francisella philomiragia]